LRFAWIGNDSQRTASGFATADLFNYAVCHAFVGGYNRENWPRAISTYSAGFLFDLKWHLARGLLIEVGPLRLVSVLFEFVAAGEITWSNFLFRASTLGHYRARFDAFQDF
jgi:hypothetical protein